MWSTNPCVECTGKMHSALCGALSIKVGAFMMELWERRPPLRIRFGLSVPLETYSIAHAANRKWLFDPESLRHLHNETVGRLVNSKTFGRCERMAFEMRWHLV